MLDKVGSILSQYQNSNVIASTIVPQFETTIKTIYNHYVNEEPRTITIINVENQGRKH
jgi:hypothetical protein